MKSIKKLVVLFIVANVFNACTEDEVSYALQNVSAPTNVSAIFNVSNDDTGTVTLTPTAEGATSFNVYFGDVDDETPTAVSPGEETSHVYGEGEFTLRIVALGASGLTSELSRIVTISFTPPSDLAITTEITASNPFEITVTPTATNATVFDIYFGDVDGEEPTTIMVGETANHIYAEAGDYTVRVLARGAGAATIESSDTITILGNSNPIILPITFDDATVNYAFGTFNGASYEVVDNPDTSGVNTEASKVGAITNSGNQFEGGAFTLGTPVDFSDADKTITMKFWSDVSVPILLKFEGGVNDERQNEVVTTHAGTGWEELSFDFATDAIKSFIDGSQGAGEAFVPTGQYATMVIFVDGPGTAAGTFYLDDIIHEGITGAIEPIIGPDAPAVSTANIFSIFSDEYTDPSGINYFPDWGQTTTYEQLDLNGDAVIKYANFNYQGIDIGEAVDATGYTTVHIDVWSNDYTALPFFLISQGSGEQSVSLTLLPNQWNSIDIPLSDYTNQGMSVNDIIQFKFDVQPDNGGTVFIDNLYFEIAPMDPTSAAMAPTYASADVFSIFSNEYTDPSGINYFPDWGQTTTYEQLDLNGDAVIKYANFNYQGIDIGEAVDATGYTTVHIDVWSNDYTALPFFLISQGSGEQSVSLTLLPNQWNSIDIPLSDYTNQGMSVNDIIQFKFDVQPDNGGTVFIDNLFFHN